MLQPSGSLDHIVARIMPYPLASGTVEPVSGGPPMINIGNMDNPQWFAMVDLFPCALFQYDVVYVLINDLNSTVVTYPATDWPSVNGVPMGEATDLILVFPLLPRPFEIASGSPAERLGDYGDAPNGQLAYEGVVGQFSTAYALTTGQEMLGVGVSVEWGMVDPGDPDGTTNIRDADSDERMFLSWDPTTTPATSHLIYDVSVASKAPEDPHYVNVLFDFDRSGDWGGITEWAVENQAVGGWHIRKRWLLRRY